MSNKLIGICLGACVGAVRAWRQCVLVAAWAVGFGISAVSHGGLIDDFQSYSAGTVSGGATGGVWTALGNADGANIQDESGNKLLTVGATANGANVKRLPLDTDDSLQSQHRHDGFHARPSEYRHRARMARSDLPTSCRPT